jgi:hypothetical protein
MNIGALVSIKDSDTPIVGVIVPKPKNARSYFQNDEMDSVLVWVRVLHYKHEARHNWIGNIYPWFERDIEVLDESR